MKIVVPVRGKHGFDQVEIDSSGFAALDQLLARAAVAKVRGVVMPWIADSDSSI